MKAFVPFLLALASIDAVLAARPLGRHRRGQDATESATPAYEYDPATTKDCVWWLDVVENFTCQQVVSIYGVAIEDFIRWNPSLQESCTTLLTLHSYCVAATDSYHSGAPATTKTATTVTTATTTVNTYWTTSTSWSHTDTTTYQPTSSSTSCTDSFVTSSSYSTSSTTSCSTFSTSWSHTETSTYNPTSSTILCSDSYVTYHTTSSSKDSSTYNAPSCATSSSTYCSTSSLTSSTAYTSTSSSTYNPTWTSSSSSYYRPTSTSAWKYSTTTYPGSTTFYTATHSSWSSTTYNPPYYPPASTQSATATTGTNGVATPLPTQPGMTKDCNKFALVRSGDTCDSVCKANGISEGDLYDMNSQVNNGSADCDNLWADAYVCVGSSGTTTSAAGTGAGAVATPSPYQPGMTDRCRQFYKVEPGMDCRRISDAYHITVGEFIAWNPAAGADCRGLWAGYYCCVAIY